MQFEQGEQLTGICFEGDEILKVGEHCDSIVVDMENGQMAGVPWFECGRTYIDPAQGRTDQTRKDLAVRTERQ